jgi:hypothetical protein
MCAFSCPRLILRLARSAMEFACERGARVACIFWNPRRAVAARAQPSIISHFPLHSTLKAREASRHAISNVIASTQPHDDHAGVFMQASINGRTDSSGLLQDPPRQVCMHTRCSSATPRGDSKHTVIRAPLTPPTNIQRMVIVMPHIDEPDRAIVTDYRKHPTHSAHNINSTTRFASVSTQVHNTSSSESCFQQQASCFALRRARSEYIATEHTRHYCLVTALT